MSGPAEDVPRKTRPDADRAALPGLAMELADRRRPGRKAAHPALLLPLCGPGSEAGAGAARRPATRKPARGIFVAVLLSLPFWLVVAVLVAWLRR